MEPLAENSSPPPALETPVQEEVEKSVGVRRKPFVYTEKRKENLAKANLARLEKNVIKKNFKGQLEDMAKDIQTIYETRLQQIINSTDKNVPLPPPEPSSDTTPPPNPPMASSTASASAIPIEPVLKERKSKKRVSYPSDSSSESDDEPVKPKKRTTKKKGKKVKTVSYDSSSSEEEEEQAPKHRKHKKPKKKKPSKRQSQYITSSEESGESEGGVSESEDEYRPAAKPSRPKTYLPAYGMGKGGRKPSIRPGYGLTRGPYSGCTF